MNNETVQSQPDDLLSTRLEQHPIMHGRLRPGWIGIHRSRISPNDRVVKSILHKRELVRRAVEQLEVRFVVGKEEFLTAVRQKAVFAE